MTPRRAPHGRVVAVAAIAALLALPFAAGGAWDIAALMQLLKSHPPGRARFDETKHVSILDRPLESSGELLFTPPDRLERRLTSPGSERMVVDRERLVIERGGRTQVLSLAEHPEIAVLVESIRGTLAGDREALERTYVLRLQGDERAWRLFLEPKDAALARLVTRVEIDGSQAQVRRVEVDQADGDSSLMQITPVSP
jgi:outer membrane lipoprotein-sorting protein